MALPSDYDANPGRFRLATRITGKYLTGPESLHGHIAGVLARAGARLVADVGCGEGALAAAVPAGAGMHVVGADASAAMLAACPPPRVRADARRLPFAADRFDAVVAVNMLYHLDDPVAALREARRILVPGGLFVAATISRHDSPELARAWRPEPSTFDTEDAPQLVASVFGSAETEPWDAPLITLPDRDAVRDYLVARWARAGQIAAAARHITPPVTLTKRGAFVYARR